MTKYYVIVLEKNKKWKIKYRTKNYYKLVSLPKVDTFDTIEDAEKHVKSLHKNTYDWWIDHRIGKSFGHLMKLDEWKESCEDGCFIDYDGYGDLYDENFEKIEFDNGVDDCFYQNVIFPSDYTDNKYPIPENAAYVMWFNR